MSEKKLIVKEVKQHGHSLKIALTGFVKLGDKFEVQRVWGTGQIILTPVKQVKA